MAYKSLLTVATSAERAELAVSGAAALAIAHDAHLDILALGVDRTQVGYSYVGSGAVILQAAIERAEQEAKEIETAARKALAAQSDTLRWSVEAAMTQLGALTDLVAQRARFADLVVLPRPRARMQRLSWKQPFSKAMRRSLSCPTAVPVAARPRVASSSPGTRAPRP
jgi:hypothetical protein